MSLLFSRPGFKVVQGDILQDRAHAPVVPVNCVPGVLGAGLAKRFADAYPGLKERHAYLCRTFGLRLCCPCMVFNVGPKPLILFPTKGNWRNDSRYEYIFQGLANLYNVLANYRPDDEEITVALPALGCGLGGLEFEVVGQMIAAWAAGLPERFTVHLYRPHRGN